MEMFAQHNSIVRRIWGSSDTILFIFAGAAAEFALNKAVDWLYFTGKLPADPLGRLFSTVSYARTIVFAEKEDAHKSIDTIYHIHKSVEQSRGDVIPDWAYRDVLFMLIHYSIASFELLERKLFDDEKEEVYNVFYRVGNRMQLKDLPETYVQWLPVREQHLHNDLKKSNYTDDLFLQYKKHLGSFRYIVLVEAQIKVMPQHVKNLLQLNRRSYLPVALYKLSKKMRLDALVKKLLLPSAYQKQIAALDVVPK